MVIDEKCDCGSEMPRIRHKGRFFDSIKVNNSYISPNEVEDLLFTNGAIGEWRLTKNDSIVTLMTEATESFDENNIRNALEELLLTSVRIEHYQPFELGFDGHECRFNGF